MIFLDEDDRLFRKDDRTIVDAFTLAAVIRNKSRKKDDDPQRVLETEPVLGTYVHQELLKIIGRLALSGAKPVICRGVVCDLYRVLDIAGSALREGYRGMLSDFLPATDMEEENSKSNQQPDKENSHEE